MKINFCFVKIYNLTAIYNIVVIVDLFIVIGEEFTVGSNFQGVDFVIDVWEFSSIGA